MIPSRPLLFATIPSLALILGFVWLRRKKSGVHCDTGGGTAKARIKDKSGFIAEPNHNRYLAEAEEEEALLFADLKRSQSLPVTSSTPAKADQQDQRLGKSAPIAIAPNNRSPPIKLTEQQIDSEILKLKLEESDIKNLRSIRELTDDEAEDDDIDSSVDLPGTPRFPQKVVAEDSQPVVIKATMAAKVSPKGSFAECKYSSSGEEKKQQKQAERDSANHTPEVHEEVVEASTVAVANVTVEDEEVKATAVATAEPESTEESRSMPVASPPLSVCSVHSTDSGKGSSPPHSEGGAALATSIYDFVVPMSVVPQLIGKKGSYVNLLKAKTGVNMIIKKHPTSSKQRICSLEGTQKEIDAALKMIRSKLPEKRFPHITLQRVIVTPPHAVIPLPALDTSCLHLQLIEGINNDVVISAVVSGGQVFLQQPLHPSYPQLNVLQTCMNQSYSMIESPGLSKIAANSICVAPIASDATAGGTAWYRVQIVSDTPPPDDTCLVKYLDYGGYDTLPTSALRQIRTDFMTIPFQAIECVLSNLKPVGDEWSAEATEVLYSLTHGIILQAQVVGYTPDGLPEVYLYACFAVDNVVFINQELVARGLAEWVPNPEDSSTCTTAA